MKLLIKKATTDVTILIFIQDSSSTTGDGLTGIVAADLTAYYSRVEDDNDVTVTEITLSDIAGTASAHTNGGIEEIASITMPGWYRFDPPDGVFATGARSAGISLIDSGANDVAQVTIEIQLIDVDLEDTVRLGLTTLPNAVVDANNGLVTGDGSVTFTAGVGNRLAVDTEAVSGDTTAADNLELATENAAAGSIAADLTHIHGTALTETAGQLAGRFVDFFDQASATFSVATALADFKATGFSTHSAADVTNDWETQSQADPTGFHVNVLEVGGTAQTANDNGADINAILVDTGTTLPATLDRNADLTASMRGFHTWQGNVYYVAPVNGNDSTGDGTRALPYATIQAAHDDLVTDSNHDVIILMADAAAGTTTHTVAATTTISKRYTFIRGPGRDFIITRTGAGDTLAITGDGVEISGVQIGTAATGSGDGIDITDADFHRVHHCWFLNTQGDGIHVLRGENCQFHDNHFEGTGVGGSGQGIHISGTAGSSNDNIIHNNHFADTGGDSILIENGTTNDTEIHHNTVHNAGGWGINIDGSSTDAQVHNNVLGNNSSGNINDGGTTSIIKNNYDIADGVWDELLTGGTHNISTSAGRILRELSEADYEGGAIWLDTVNGAAGTTVGENGTANNPVNSIADALTLAGSTGLVRIRVASGSSVTLAAALEGFEIFNSNWTLALGGQSISNSSIIGATVSGTATGANEPKFIGCHFNNATLPPCHLNRCGFAGTITLGSAGNFYFEMCHSMVAGTGAPDLDFGSGLNASNVSFRHYSGGIEIQNMGAGSGSYNMSLEGDGQLIVNANCSATSTIAIRGHFPVTGDATAIAAITFSEDARFTRTRVTGGDYALNTTASGNIGVDWANVENPSTAVDLSATDIQLCDTVTTLTNKTGFVLGATGLDSILVDGKDLPNALEIIAAGVIGKISGAGTGTEVFVGLDESTTRATVTVDASGNRSSVVYV